MSWDEPSECRRGGQRCTVTPRSLGPSWSCAGCRSFATTTCPARLQFQSFMCRESHFCVAFGGNTDTNFCESSNIRKSYDIPIYKIQNAEFTLYNFESRCHTYCIFKLPTNIKQLIKIRTAVLFEAKSTELQMTVLLSLITYQVKQSWLKPTTVTLAMWILKDILQMT